MESTQQTNTSNPNLLEQVKKQAIRRWGLETLTGIVGLQQMMFHGKEQQKNLAAEGKAVRNKVWGVEEPMASEDDMGSQIVLGDYHPPQVVMPPQQPQSSGWSKAIAAASLAAAVVGIPGAGAISYLAGQLNQSKAVAPQQDTEDVSLRLLQLEDLEFEKNE